MDRIDCRDGVNLGEVQAAAQQRLDLARGPWTHPHAAIKPVLRQQPQILDGPNGHLEAGKAAISDDIALLGESPSRQCDPEEKNQTRFSKHFDFLPSRPYSDSAEKSPIKPVCHSEQSEESRVFQDLRPFTSFRVTFRGHYSAESYSETLGDLTIRRLYMSSSILKSFQPALPPL